MGVVVKILNGTKSSYSIAFTTSHINLSIILIKIKRSSLLTFNLLKRPFLNPEKLQYIRNIFVPLTAHEMCPYRFHAHLICPATDGEGITIEIGPCVFGFGVGCIGAEDSCRGG